MWTETRKALWKSCASTLTLEHALTKLQGEKIRVSLEKEIFFSMVCRRVKILEASVTLAVQSL